MATVAMLGSASAAFAGTYPVHITDPAGDAIYAGVLNDNNADLLAVDANLSTSSLTLTDTVAAVLSSSSIDYAVEVTRYGPNNGTQLLSIVTANAATLQVSDAGGLRSVKVTGTATYDTARGTVAAVYSRAAINAALARYHKAPLALTDQVSLSASAADHLKGATDSASDQGGF
ncbi:MAG: hypothetical protein M3256_14790 [Actinomycetota bacterium]|nr:hypothetical protein [Actinomycetota bacterium]